MKNRGKEVVEVYSGNLWDAHLLKSRLDDAEIPCFLKNHIITSFAYKPSYSQAVKIMVLAADFEIAQQFVNQFSNNSM